MKTYTSETLTISEQAARWLCEVADGGQDSQAALLAWLRQSPRHVEEFLFATATWNKLRQTGEARLMDVETIIAEVMGAHAADNVVALQAAKNLLRSPASSPAAHWWRIEQKGWRWAASFAAMAAIAGLGWWMTAGVTTYETVVGEQRTIQLPDGSVLYLNTDSKARVHFTDDERSVRLEEGEALFVVAQDTQRPFRVRSGSATVQAVGTQFNVRRRAAEVVVSVLEGRVKVASQEAERIRPLVDAGEEASIARNGLIFKRTPRDIGQAVAWRERRLVFKDAHLGDVVAEINRYSTRRFRIEGPAAHQTTLTATFDADNPESLANFLKRYSELTVERQDDGFLIRDRIKD